MAPNGADETSLSQESCQGNTGEGSTIVGGDGSAPNADALIQAASVVRQRLEQFVSQTVPQNGLAAVPIGTQVNPHEQLVWHQALSQLTGAALGGVPQPQFEKASQQAPVTVAGSNSEQSYILPGVHPGVPIASSMTNVSGVPVDQFLQAIQSVPAAAQGVTSQALIAPALPSNPVKRKLEEAGVGTKGQKVPKIEPSVISSYSSNMSLAQSALSEDSSTKDFLEKVNVDLDSMTPAERRRHERNLREQQRSYRISQQIKQLRDVLTESKIPFKANKFSILVASADYIKQLQSRAIMLDAEHQKLFETIRETSELVTSGQVPSSVDEPKVNEVSSCSGSDSNSDMLLVQGLDYVSIFENCPFAMGVTALDGRLVACNGAFESMIGHTREEMVQQSIFMFIRNHQDIFEAMANLLKRSSMMSETGEGTVREEPFLYWCGQIISPLSQKLSFNITLTNTQDGNPKFFSFTASELPE